MSLSRLSGSGRRFGCAVFVLVSCFDFIGYDHDCMRVGCTIPLWFHEWRAARQVSWVGEKFLSEMILVLLNQEKLDKMRR